jgi:hypothetical protein
MIVSDKEAITNYINFRKEELKNIEKIDLPRTESITLKLEKLSFDAVSKKWNAYLEQQKELKEKFFALKKGPKKVIYKIDVDTPSIGRDMIEKLIHYKSSEEYREKGIALSKINGYKEGKVLYIGSSENGIEKRLKEHLGFGSKSTYSMQLHHWIESIAPNGLTITINLYPFEDTMGSVLLKNIEYALWYHYKPLLGKGELDLDPSKITL